MILLTLSRGKGEETVRLQLPASPAEIEETFAFLDRISLDTTATAILDVSSNVPVLYRCLYDVDVEDSEQFQKLQKLAERTEALSPAKAAIFSGALDAECVWNLEGALTVADRLDEYMLVNNVSSDSELGIYLVNKGITPFPDRFKPYINYARVGAEYREKHGGEYSSGNYVQKKTPELLENERLDGVFRIWMENPCPVRVQSETAQITLPATFEQLESARQLLGVDSLNMAKLTRVEALRPYLGEYLPLQGMDLRLEQLDELAENIRIMDQEDGALLKYLSVLEVEQPATLQEALRFSIELDDYDEEWAAEDNKFRSITSFTASRASLRELRDYLADTLKYARIRAERQIKAGELPGGWFDPKDWDGWQKHMEGLIHRLDGVLALEGSTLELAHPPAPTVPELTM